MKKLIFGLGISVWLMGSALANTYDYQEDCCYLSPCESYCEEGFGGFYLGGNFGLVTQTAFRTTNSGNEGIRGHTYVETDGNIGVQTGYDWNCGYGVFGLVTDWDWANIYNTYIGSDQEVAHTVTLDWYLTIRARIGITASNCLFYVTAGAALAHIETKWDEYEEYYYVNHSHWGWTGGVGFDYLLGCKWSLGADLLYMNFAHERFTFVNNLILHRSDTIWVVRAIINYHFSNLFNNFCCKM